MLETIEKNGEFEKYVEMLAEREERERKAVRKRNRERKRLLNGDAEISEESEEPEEELSDWSASDSYDEQCDVDVVSDFQVTAGGEGGQVKAATPSISGIDARSMKKRNAFSKASDLQDLAMRFNALRFLAMNLKSQNDTLRK